MTDSTSAPVRNYVRLYVRAKSDRTIRITFERDGQDVVIETRCTNLCVGGFFAQLPEHLDVGQQITLEFTTKFAVSPIRLQALVRHVHGTETGFEFVAPSAAEQAAIKHFFVMETEDSG